MQVILTIILDFKVFLNDMMINPEQKLTNILSYCKLTGFISLLGKCPGTSGKRPKSGAANPEKDYKTFRIVILLETLQPY